MQDPTVPVQRKAVTAAPDPAAPGLCAPFRLLIEITSRQQQTRRTLLNLLRVEYAIEKPSNKLLAVADLRSDTWEAEVKRIRGKKLPLTRDSELPLASAACRLYSLRHENT